MDIQKRPVSMGDCCHCCLIIICWWLIVFDSWIVTVGFLIIRLSVANCMLDARAMFFCPLVLLHVLKNWKQNICKNTILTMAQNSVSLNVLYDCTWSISTIFFMYTILLFSWCFHIFTSSCFFVSILKLRIWKPISLFRVLWGAHDSGTQDCEWSVLLQYKVPGTVGSSNHRISPSTSDPCRSSCSLTRSKNSARRSVLHVQNCTSTCTMLEFQLRSTENVQ